MNDSTGGVPPAPTPPPPRRTRRWVLGAGLAVAAGGGGGVGAEFLARRPARRRVQPSPPVVLLAALDAERRLIADLDATTGGTAATRRVVEQVRADHTEHLRVLHALVAAYGGRATAASSSPAAGSSTPAGPSSLAGSSAPAGSSTPAGTARTRAQLQAAEQRAATVAAGRADRLHGPQAALLASIAACEATHAEMLR